MQKKIKPIVVILIITMALLALGGSALAKEITDSADDSEKAVKPDIEEEEAIIIDDPPFITLLKTKQYYYDYRHVSIRTGEDIRSGYAVRVFAKNCNYSVLPDGFGLRNVRDYSTNELFTTTSMPGAYNNTNKQPIGNWWSKMTDYSRWIAIGTGTEELLGETLQYIDYRAPDGLVTRCYLKDGDVYAMWQVRIPDGSSGNLAVYVSNFNGNPSNSYFNVR